MPGARLQQDATLGAADPSRVMHHIADHPLVPRDGPQCQVDAGFPIPTPFAGQQEAGELGGGFPVELEGDGDRFGSTQPQNESHHAKEQRMGFHGYRYEVIQSASIFMADSCHFRRQSHSRAATVKKKRKPSRLAVSTNAKR